MASASPHHIDSSFLLDALDALKQRQATLPNQDVAPAIHRAIEFQGGVPRARIEILFQQCRSQMLSIHLWEDRAISLHAGEAMPNGGWMFRYGSAGRFPGPNEGPELMAAAEASLLAMSDSSEADPERLEAIWRPLIAKGPRLA
ncbi:hypothetical protein HZY97_13490 [Sphingomonas sp. R-74633]|uniref:hypothetical protein n=1 Tax=Sphingomonas sp. R-74633 TaxID=2751188 RepID=UPI0015D23F9C|nr:hypothetical protein [Sphingomonas sp. R-74633]NYT41779.1 hypothetical protein [Sphingomonas sp. R-74633]